MKSDTPPPAPKRRRTPAAQPKNAPPAETVGAPSKRTRAPRTTTTAPRAVPLAPAPALPTSAGAPDSAAIARRAYQLYEERSCVHGHDLDDWLRAEAELMSATAEGVAHGTNSNKPA